MHYNSNVDQHACAYLCVDWSFKWWRIDPENIKPRRSWTHKAPLHRRCSIAWYGIQLPAIYDFADSDIPVQNGYFLIRSKRRFRGKSGADIQTHHPAIIIAGRDQRNHISIFAGSKLLLHSKAVRRRSVFPYWKYDWKPVYYSRRVELRKCHLYDHGSYYDAAYDGSA